MPHKAAVAAAVDARTAVAERLGVVNCVFVDDDGGTRRLVGDSEWRTGLPMTAARRVAPVGAGIIGR
jgi:hypothetical protein